MDGIDKIGDRNADMEGKFGFHRLLGPAQGLEKTLHIENILKKYIKDSHNSTKIGATNIFWGNYLDSKLQLSRYSDNSDMGNSFRSNFCHQEGSGIIFKYSVILG